MTNHIHLKINKELPPYRVGDIAKIRCDEEGTPLDQYWRNRLQDAGIDKCVSITDESGNDILPKSKTKKFEDIK